MRSFLPILLCFFQLFYSTPLLAQLTPFERSDSLHTATYDELIAAYQELDRRSPKVRLMPGGPTDAGIPLHVVLVSGDGKPDIRHWKQSGKVILLINNGIHPGEPDGIDASLLLVRDVARGKVTLPSQVVLAVIPVYNIGGCLNRGPNQRVNQNGPPESGFRGNARNLDLNRDFMKCDSREAQSFAALFQALDPDLLVDTHVSDGADFQHTLTLITGQPDKLGGALGQFVRTTLDPALYAGLRRKGVDMIPYVDFGAEEEAPKGWTGFYDPPRYSSGYAALFQTPAYITETHMLKPFPQRVKATYQFLLSLAEEAGRQGRVLQTLRRQERLRLGRTEQMPLRWTWVEEATDTIRFSGYHRDSVRSEATGLWRMRYDHQRPYVRETPYFNRYRPVDSVKVPEAYIVPAAWESVLTRLRANGIRMQPLVRDTLMEVTGYRVKGLETMRQPYESHYVHTRSDLREERVMLRFRRGDFVITTRQPGRRYLVEVLEPRGEDSFWAWNFFDGVLQQKEGFSDYRWEELAAEVLRGDTALQRRLEEKKREDAAFAQDSHKILDFIYKNSKYYEKSHQLIPVFRLEAGAGVK